MTEPGTTLPRPSEWGKALDEDWWTKTSDALLRRLLGYAAGEGPPQDQTKRLSKGLQISFRAPESDDWGERHVRAFLGPGVDKESTDRLYVSLCDGLVARAGPLVARQLAATQPTEGEGASIPSAAIRSGGDPNPSGRPTPAAGSPSVRPRPARKKGRIDQPGWWQKAIVDFAKRDFEDESDIRELIYLTYIEELKGRQKDEFAKAASVLPNAKVWEGRFNRAVSLSLMARGVKPSDLQQDDAYHFATQAEVPKSLRSTSLVGELVHAAWQFHYLHSEPYSNVLAEYMFFAGALPESGPNPIRQMSDYREIWTNPEQPTWLGAAAWAFGKQKPDILDFNKGRIIEIKPVRSAPAGVLQLWRYTHNFNCARLFDELTKAGVTGKLGYAIEPQHLPRYAFNVLDLNDFLEKYFAARDKDKDEVDPRDPSIPKKRRRVGRSQIEGVVRANRLLKAVPWTWPEIPGLVIYTIHETKRPDDDPDDPWTPPPAGPGVVAIVVSAVVVVTVVLVTIALWPLIVGAVAGEAVAGGSAALAESTVVAETEVAVVETCGGAIEAEQFEPAAEEIGNRFAELAEKRVLE